MKTILSFLSPRSGIYPGALRPFIARSAFIGRRPFIARSAFILLIALAISACSEEAMNTDTDTGKMEGIPLSDVPIAFTNPGQAGDGLLPLSAGDRTTDNLTAMTVYAHYTGTDDFDNAATASTPNFMFNQSVTKYNGGWTYAPLKYWPAQHEKVSFFAIAPGPAAENGIELITSNDSYTGYPSFTVTPPASPALQEDLCLASTLNLADNTNGGKVPLHFDHTMAKVTFAAKYVSDETLDVFMRQIKLTDIYSSNTLRLTATSFEWNTPATKGDYSLFAADNTLVGTPLIKDGDVGDATVSTEAGTLMLLPQTIPAGAKLKVWTRWAGKDLGIVEINMPELTWEAGKSYNYNLTIAEDGLSAVQWDWEYTDGAQSFTAPIDGTYSFEAWGAGGGSNSSAIGGPGGYTQGEISLTAGQTVYVYVGQAGDVNKSTTDNSVPPTFNGGGQGGHDVDYGDESVAGSGGGATDFRLLDGDWDNASSLNSRIMVAGGGGGGESADTDCIQNGGYGGGLTGGQGEGASQTSHGATGGGRGGSQTTGGGAQGTGATAGQFGIGGNGGYKYSSSRWFGGGGGGGYYGGGAGGFTNFWRRAGGGGSSFISGMTNCVAIDPTSITEPRAQDSNGNTAALNYNSAFGASPTWNDGADILFTNPSMIDGAGYEWNTGAKGTLTNMPSPAGGTMTGNTGNGHARITLISI
jgi:hypothetical protein